MSCNETSTRLHLPRVVISSTCGGGGKTLLSLGLARFLRNRGWNVLPFKKGPDYIDAAWLTQAAGHPACNLDPFFLSAEKLRLLFALRTGHGLPDRETASAASGAHPAADLALLEGNRGLFDGMDVQGSCSTAELARTLACPVLLSLNCTKMTRTAAAVVAGLAHFEPGLHLAGVILGQTASSRHEDILRRAIETYTDIPVLGAVVRVVTFRDYQYDDGHNTADVHVPELGGSDAADEVNDQVQAFTDQLIAQFQADCEATGEGYQGLDITSSVVTDSDTWFTLRIDATKVKASGYDLTRFYHIDKATGEIVTLSDLFRPGADYVSALSAEVLRQMEEQMAADASLSYLTDEFTAIDPEQSFYWNADGDLVLVFDEYTVAAGSLGMVEFTIPGEVYAALLR